MSIHPSSVPRLTPSNMSSSAWSSGVAAVAVGGGSTAASSRASSRPPSRGHPATSSTGSALLGEPSRSRARQPANHLTVSPDEPYPFAPPAPATAAAAAAAAAATAASRATSRARPAPAQAHSQAQSTDSPPRRPVGVPAARAVPIRRVTESSGSTRPRATVAAHAHSDVDSRTLAQQYASLQEQHARLTSPIREATRDSPPPTKKRPVAASRPAAATRAASVGRTRMASAAILDVPYVAPSNRSRATAAAPRLSVEALSAHEDTFRGSNGVGAPASHSHSASLSTPSRATSPAPTSRASPTSHAHAQLQSDLNSLDEQIRQNTADLLQMQQQQQLHAMQQQQTAMQAKMREIQEQQQQQQQLQHQMQQVQQQQQQQQPPQPQLQSQQTQQPAYSLQTPHHPAYPPQSHAHSFPSHSPPPPPPASWYRSASPAPPSASLGSESDALHSRSSSASGAMVGVPAPLVSRNNPFVSLVDAIDNVLAKSTAANAAAAGANAYADANATAMHAHHLAQTQQAPHAQHHQQPHQFGSWSQPPQHTLQSFPSHSSPAGASAPAPAEAPPTKTHLQLLSESRAFGFENSLSPQTSLSNTLNAILASSASDGTTMHQRSQQQQHALDDGDDLLHVPSSLLRTDASDATRAAGSASSTGAFDSDMFDVYPELSSHPTLESLKLSNTMLREKGSGLMKQHVALRGKFDAVRSLLSEYYTRKDREVAVARLDAIVERRNRDEARHALYAMREHARAKRERDEARREKLHSILRSRAVADRARETTRARLAFAQWKEAAIRLAMRAVQNTWLREWEDDIRFEARRTALAVALHCAANRERIAAMTAQARRFHTWRMSAVYARVKDIFAKHTGAWESDRAALLKLALEANDARESLARTADAHVAERAALQTAAAQSTDLVHHVAGLNEEAAALRSQTEELRRRANHTAAQALVHAVWNARCARVRRALRIWSEGARNKARATADSTHFAHPQPATHAPSPHPHPSHQSVAAPARAYDSTSFAPSLYPAGPLQQLSASPSSPSLLSPRHVSLSGGASLDGDDDSVFDASLTSAHAIDAKLAEFEAAKARLEEETVSLAARLAATRAQQAQQGSRNTTKTEPVAAPATANERASTNGVHPHSQQQQRQQEPLVSFQKPAPRSQHQPSAQPHHPPSSHAPLTHVHSPSVVSLHAYAPADESTLIAADLDQSFAADQYEPEEAAEAEEEEEYPMPDGRLLPNPDLIQPPLVFDEQVPVSRSFPQPTSGSANHSRRPSAHALAQQQLPVAAAAPRSVVAPPSAASIAHSASVSPTRAALISSVFLEFHRSFALRARVSVGGGTAFDPASIAGRIGAEDVPRALRKAGLRAGDLATAKLDDDSVRDMLARRGWERQDTIDQEQFQQIANDALFNQ